MSTSLGPPPPREIVVRIQTSVLARSSRLDAAERRPESPEPAPVLGSHKNETCEQSPAEPRLVPDHPSPLIGWTLVLGGND